MKHRHTLGAGAALMLATMTAHAGLVHNYELNNSLADQFGGPSLTSLGGVLNATSYSFGVNQGLRLAGAFANPGQYSIEMKFNFSSVDGWRKIVDFSNLSLDDGLYNYYTALQFVDLHTSIFSNGPEGAFAPGADVQLILTRNGSSKQVVGYINGIEQINFTDSADQAVFPGAGGTANFFIDDAATGGSEASAGVADFIRLYDIVLSPAQATCLARGTPESCGLTATPEPTSLALLLAGLPLLGRLRRSA